jgi:hypothetical protein
MSLGMLMVNSDIRRLASPALILTDGIGSAAMLATAISFHCAQTLQHVGSLWPA